MSVPILTFSLKFNVSKTCTNRVYVNQLYCNRIYTQEKTTGFELYVRNRLVSHTCTHCGPIYQNNGSLPHALYMKKKPAFLVFVAQVTNYLSAVKL